METSFGKVHSLITEGRIRERGASFFTSLRPGPPPGEGRPHGSSMIRPTCDLLFLEAHPSRRPAGRRRKYHETAGRPLGDRARNIAVDAISPFLGLEGFTPAGNRLSRGTQPMIRLALTLALAAAAPTAPPEYLYRASLVQAAPGKLLEVIDLYKGLKAGADESGDEAPLWMRHSQGDHWDLLLLFPIESYALYYAPARVAKREKTTRSRESLL